MEIVNTPADVLFILLGAIMVSGECARQNPV